MTMIPAKDFYMIRHGETEANAAKIMAGSLDSPLNETGRKQAQTARDLFSHLDEKPCAIVHSPLSRAKETAEIINSALNIPMIEDADIAELHAGEWEGVPYDQCQEILHGWTNPPGGETFDEFFTRIKRSKNRALAEYDGRVLFVSHGGVFRAFAKLYGMNIWGVRNCDLHEFLPQPQDSGFPWRVHRFQMTEGLTRTLSDSFHPEEIA